jgi:hypothetical protein
VGPKEGDFDTDNDGSDVESENDEGSDSDGDESVAGVVSVAVESATKKRKKGRSKAASASVATIQAPVVKKAKKDRRSGNIDFLKRKDMGKPQTTPATKVELVMEGMEKLKELGGDTCSGLLTPQYRTWVTQVMKPMWGCLTDHCDINNETFTGRWIKKGKLHHRKFAGRCHGLEDEPCPGVGNGDVASSVEISIGCVGIDASIGGEGDGSVAGVT